jgi:DNA-binding transcriptional LysR family regulator
MASANLERLRILHAVAAHGTIAAAARANSYTASAVSQQLAALEREVGTSLLERSNRGITLTPAGRVLSERASVILDLVEGALADVSETARTDSPTTIRVGAFPTAIASIVLPAIQHLSATVRLQIVDLEPEQALEALAARMIDAAIVDRFDHADPVTGTTAGRLDRTTLRVEHLRLVHPSRRRPRSIPSLAGEPWVLGGRSSRLGRATRAVCAAAGFEPDVVVETDDHHVAFDAIASLGAFALLPDLALEALRPGISVARTIDTGATRRIDFVTRHVPRRNAALVALEAALRPSAADGHRSPS